MANRITTFYNMQHNCLRRSQNSYGTTSTFSIIFFFGGGKRRIKTKEYFSIMSLRTNQPCISEVITIAMIFYAFFLLFLIYENQTSIYLLCLWVVYCTLPPSASLIMLTTCLIFPLCVFGSVPLPFYFPYHDHDLAQNYIILVYFPSLCSLIIVVTLF